MLISGLANTKPTWITTTSYHNNDADFHQIESRHIVILIFDTADYYLILSHPDMCLQEPIGEMIGIWKVHSLIKYSTIHTHYATSSKNFLDWQQDAWKVVWSSGKIKWHAKPELKVYCLDSLHLKGLETINTRYLSRTVGSLPKSVLPTARLGTLISQSIVCLEGDLIRYPYYILA